MPHPGRLAVGAVSRRARSQPTSWNHSAFSLGGNLAGGELAQGQGDEICLKLAWKNVCQLDLQLVEDSLQLVEREMVFAAFQAVQRGVRETDAPREFRVRQTAPLLFQKSGELAFQLTAHAWNLPLDS